MTAAEARKFLEQHQIEFVLAQFVDIHGSPKAKCVPVAHFESRLDRRAHHLLGRNAINPIAPRPHELDAAA